MFYSHMFLPQKDHSLTVGVKAAEVRAEANLGIILASVGNCDGDQVALVHAVTVVTDVSLEADSPASQIKVDELFRVRIVTGLATRQPVLEVDQVDVVDHFVKL